MSWSLISGAVVSGGSASENDPFTLGPIDTTGGDLIVVTCAAGGSAGGATISDNKGNTYTLVTSGPCEIHYCQAPTVGSGHTFTMSGGSEFAPSMSVAAYSGSAATPLDQSNLSSSAQPGSITPTQDGELIVTGLDGIDGSSFTIDSGFTVATYTSFHGGQWWASAQAYLVQTTAAAVDPTWSYGRSSSIASFKPAASGGGTATANLSATDAADTASFQAQTVVSAQLSATDAADTASFNADITGSAQLAATDAADTAAFTSLVGSATSLQLAATDQADTASFNAGITGSAQLAATDAADTAAFSTLAGAFGTLNATDTADTAAFNAATGDAVQLSATDPADTAAFTAQIISTAQIAATDPADTASFIAIGPNHAQLSATDQPDTALFIAIVPLDDSNKLKAYSPRAYPQLDTGVPRYLANEFKSVSTSVTSLMDVIQKLEDRIKALGG